MHNPSVSSQTGACVTLTDLKSSEVFSDSVLDAGFSFSLEALVHNVLCNTLLPHLCTQNVINTVILNQYIYIYQLKTRFCYVHQHCHLVICNTQNKLANNMLTLVNQTHKSLTESLHLHVVRKPAVDMRYSQN